MYMLIYVTSMACQSQDSRFWETNIISLRAEAGLIRKITQTKILFSLRANVVVVGDLVQLNKVFLLVQNMSSFVAFKNQTHQLRSSMLTRRCKIRRPFYSIIIILEDIFPIS